MNHCLIIVGAGGHGKVVADIALKKGYTDIALKKGYTDIAFLDDNALGERVGFPIIDTSANIEALNDGNHDFVIGVGNNAIRKKIAMAYDVPWVTLIHPSAQIGYHAKIGKGTVIMANATVNADASVGSHCIINSNAVVEHDCILENYVHLSPAAALGGTVYVGEETHIGIGAHVKNNISICSHCTIGVGAAVVKNITEEGIYIGVPARKE